MSCLISFPDSEDSVRYAGSNGRQKRRDSKKEEHADRKVFEAVCFIPLTRGGKLKKQCNEIENSLKLKTRVK